MSKATALLTLSIPPTYVDGHEYDSNDLGMGRYTNRWGKAPLTALERAVTWLGERMALQGTPLSRATLVANPYPQDTFGPCNVEFATAGTSGNETTVLMGAAEAVFQASVTLTGLQSELAGGTGANVYNQAPDFVIDSKAKTTAKA